MNDSTRFYGSFLGTNCQWPSKSSSKSCSKALSIRRSWYCQSWDLWATSCWKRWNLIVNQFANRLIIARLIADHQHDIFILHVHLEFRIKSPQHASQIYQLCNQLSPHALHCSTNHSPTGRHKKMLTNLSLRVNLETFFPTK
jgi:hypothetical protein